MRGWTISEGGDPDDIIYVTGAVLANDAPSWLRRDPGQSRPRPPSARTQLRAARANRRPRKPSRPLGLVQNVRALTHPFTKHLAHSPTCDRRAGGARVWPANTALILPTRRSVGRNGAFLACFWLATARYPLPGRGAAPCAIAANRGARRPCAGARIPCSPPIPTRSQAHRLAVGELEPPFCAQAGRRVCGQCGKTAQTAGRACRPVSGHATRASQHAGSCRQMQRAEGGVGAGGQSPPLHTNNSRPLKLE